jgi:hypothetical protein
MILAKDDAIVSLAKARDEFRTAFRAAQVEQNAEHDARRGAEQERDALVGSLRTARAAISAWNPVRDWLMRGGHVAEGQGYVDACLAVLSAHTGGAEQADAYKVLADGLGATLKKVAAALHVDPGDEIAKTAEAVYAELAELRAKRGQLLSAATAALVVDDEIFGRLGALLDCHAGAEPIIEAIQDLDTRLRKALQDVSDRDRWLEACGQTTERLRLRIAKVREAASLD